MSNLGLKKFAENNGISFVPTKVGDRYVLEEMLKNDYNIGGEQSGHVILLDYNPTGDGILTSLMLISILLEKNMKASDVFENIEIYPQVLVNARVNESKKYDYSEDEEIQNQIKKLEEEFLGEGRVLIRTSGTEPLVRVMIEGKNQNLIEDRAKKLAALIERKFN
jgi:phosphoglucosamine mutase